jgi:hypothetical protein
MLTKIRCNLVLGENIDDQGNGAIAYDTNDLIDIIYRNDGKNGPKDFSEDLPSEV